MERRLRLTSFLQDHEDPDEPSSENGPDCSSGDDSKLPAEPSPKKRRCMQKRVVSIPIGDMEGSRSRGEVFPPSDSWTWRKYGQKPIKGSPYPRGYYRCSSAKGCPARKQVERSHLDPTMLLVTYASDHNHPRPLPLPHPHTHPHRPAPPPSPKPHEDSTPSSEPLDPELADDPLLGNSDEFGWLGDVAVTAQVFDRPIYDSGDLAAVRLDLGEDEESLFADLGELPECSFVFRPGKWRFSTAVPCCGSTR